MSSQLDMVRDIGPFAPSSDTPDTSRRKARGTRQVQMQTPCVIQGVSGRASPQIARSGRRRISRSGKQTTSAREDARPPPQHPQPVPPGPRTGGGRLAARRSRWGSPCAAPRPRRGCRSPCAVRGHARHIHHETDIDAVEGPVDEGAMAHEPAQPEIGLDQSGRVADRRLAVEIVSSAIRSIGMKPLRPRARGARPAARDAGDAAATGAPRCAPGSVPWKLATPNITSMP
jgi:hypothetical protein